VLGSVPGQASARAAEYYAHPRNAFWPIVLGALLGEEPNYQKARHCPYNERISLIEKNHIALWDVLASCVRPGSLDSAIQRSSEQANPLAEWLIHRPSVTRICFNGKTAEALFKRHIKAKNPTFAAIQSQQFLTLPSTSPAMAAMSLEEKFALWYPALTA